MPEGCIQPSWCMAILRLPGKVISPGLDTANLSFLSALKAAMVKARRTLLLPFLLHMPAIPPNPLLNNLHDPSLQHSTPPFCLIPTSHPELATTNPSP
ncbi:hypothetical protein Pmani_022698 [Petrolisthes manimaculis]|uniref:Uncharacterized protein n=1 Tax=Petrolisthes manimaculis TaxID=1843537 RepID=A0AAE1PC93_9EUCA|nr:hypothetical protein Pmani_022698 [Petrolisthes manimaculis]